MKRTLVIYGILSVAAVFFLEYRASVGEVLLNPHLVYGGQTETARHEGIISSDGTICSASVYPSCGGGKCGSTTKYKTTSIGGFALTADAYCDTKMCGAAQIVCGSFKRPNCH